MILVHFNGFFQLFVVIFIVVASISAIFFVKIINIVTLQDLIDTIDLVLIIRSFRIDGFRRGLYRFVHVCCASLFFIDTV